MILDLMDPAHRAWYETVIRADLVLQLAVGKRYGAPFGNSGPLAGILGSIHHRKVKWIQLRYRGRYRISGFPVGKIYKVASRVLLGSPIAFTSSTS